MFRKSWTVIVAAIVCSSALAQQPTVAKQNGASAKSALPFGAVRRLGSERFRHQNTVTALAFSPDGKQIWTGCGTPELNLWDLATGQLDRALDLKGNAAQVFTMTPDGRQIVVAYGGRLLFWDAATGKLLRKSDKVGAVSKIVFAPNAKILAALQHEEVLLIDTATGKLLHKVGKRQKGWVSSVDFSRDGSVVAVGGYLGFEHWDTATGAKLPRWPNQFRQGTVVKIHARRRAPVGTRLRPH